MRYRNLGSAGVQVSELCLGAMMFGGATSAAESVRIIHRALDDGINFIDTANVYAKGESERIVGNANRERRDRVARSGGCHRDRAVQSRPAFRGARGDSRETLGRGVVSSVRRPRLSTLLKTLARILRSYTQTET